MPVKLEDFAEDMEVDCMSSHRLRVLPTPITPLRLPIICSSLNRLRWIGSAPSKKDAELHFTTVLFQWGEQADCLTHFMHACFVYA
jgi:hypothetical protein